MALRNVLLLSQLTGNVLAFVFSVCLSVPIVVHLASFQGHCLLFSNGTRNETGHLVVHWATQVSCDATVFVGILMAAVAIYQVIRLAALLRNQADSSFLASFVDTVICWLLMLGSLAAAVLVTLGFKAWCDTIVRGYQSCAGASVSGVYKEDQKALSEFYVQMGTAQFGAWGSWVCWVALAVCALLKLCRHHQRQNLMASMARERRRLLREGAEEEEDESPRA